MNSLSRRDLMRYSGLGLLGASGSGWFARLAAGASAELAAQQRHCVLLWMNGGPSQIDTFDMKPGHANGGEFSEIATTAPGLRICEHLPKLAAHGERLAVLRGLSTREGDHSRATYLMRTGQVPGGALRYPALGCSLAKALRGDDSDLPNYVSISPYQAFNQAAFGPGFLGPRYSPVTVGAVDRFDPDAAASQTDQYAQLGVDNLHLAAGVNPNQAQARTALWGEMQQRFLRERDSQAARAHDTIYRRALRMMNSDAVRAFDLSQESDETRQRYGTGRFGQGCLMARRLIERGVPFVEVALGGFDAGGVGWDTHLNNFNSVKSLCGRLDAGWASLMTDLAERGLLERTTILWMGEFGRTPQINGQAGRDHFPNAWSCVLAGGGIAGGGAYGATTEDGMEVADGKTTVGEVLATYCKAAGVSPDRENYTETNRPVKLAEGAPIKAVLA